MTHWQRYTNARIARRRLLAGAATATAAGALAIACGGDDEAGGSAPGDATSKGLLYTPADTTAQAKPGGLLKDYSRDEGGSFDALASGDSTTFTLVAEYTYPRIFKFSTGTYPDESKAEILGDLAESWEISPDKMTLTLKLRKNLRWENKAPVNGREIDSQDVVASWKKYSTRSSYAGQVAYTATNPSAPVVSMDALDPYTVKVNMFRPDPSVLALLGWNFVRVMPREFDGGFNPASDVIGFGPYLLREYKPSVGFTWQKSPNYYVKDRPFIERIERPIVPEYAAQLSQFRAGNIHTSVATPADLLPTKRDLPKLLLLIGAGHISFNGVHMTFGYEQDGSKFEDIRVRQAINYLIDRKAYEDLLTNRKALSAEGINLEGRLATWLGPSWQEYWLDPFDQAKFGPNAKYFKFDIAEAKKLLAAAGHPNGFETSLFFPAGRGGYQQQLNDIMPGFLSAGGIKCNSEGVDNNNVFIPNMLRAYAGGKAASGKGTNGLKMIAGGTRVTADLSLANYYDSGGPSFIGMPVPGRRPEVGDPAIVDLVRKIRQEFDHKTQVSLTHDFHRLMAEKAYGLPLHWSTPTLQLIWPVLGNAGYFTQSAAGSVQAESRLQWWIDSKKAPLA